MVRHRLLLPCLFVITVPAILGAARCTPGPHILVPVAGQLSSVGIVPVRIELPADAEAGTLRVLLDGRDVTQSLGPPAPGVVAGALDVPTPGWHELRASAKRAGSLGVRLGMRVAFETVALREAERCDVLNDAACLLPYPSSRFLSPAPSATGRQLELPPEGLPDVVGPPVSPAPWNQLDGYSPGVQLLMHFPQGVDLERSGAPRLLPEGCCGQPAGPPWRQTRTFDGRSLETDSPTVLVDADTGERILHFVELDPHGEGNPVRQVLILRPGRLLRPGHRYVVAVRRLFDPSGAPVEAEPVFAAARDRRPIVLPAARARADQLEADVFPVLEREGVARESLVLAFDFVVRSDTQLSRQALSMRDQAFAHLAAVEAVPTARNFAVERVVERDCSAPWHVNWREVTGTFQVPLFLTGDPATEWVQFLRVDEIGEPVASGLVAAPFTILIPCSVLDPAAPPARRILMGAGSGETGLAFAQRSQREFASAAGEVGHLVGASDWSLLAGSGFVSVVSNAIGTGSSRLNDFPAVPDRLRQEIVQALLLGRMMAAGHFDRDPVFRTPDGRGVFASAESELSFYGFSLGAGLGFVVAALSPDIQRVALDALGSHSAWSVRRTSGWPFVSFALGSIGITDAMEVTIVVALLQELWTVAEPVGYAEHITGAPLPGVPMQRPVFLSTAWLDPQANNLWTEIAARTLGLPNQRGSAVEALQQIAEQDAPLSSAFVSLDFGYLDLGEPGQAALAPPLADLPASTVCSSHNALVSWSGHWQQLANFLRPTGMVDAICDGPCDAVSAREQAYVPCDPAGSPRPVILRNDTTELRVFGGGIGGGLVVRDGYFTYRDTATGIAPNWSVDPLLILADGSTIPLSDRRRGALGTAQAAGEGVARSEGSVANIVIAAESVLDGRVARTRFWFTSAVPLDGTTFVFFVDDDLGTLWWDDVSSFTGSVGGGDLVLLQSDAAAGGVTTLLSGRALAGAELSRFGAGTFPETSVALEDEGDLSALSANGAGFESEGIGGRSVMLAFDLRGPAAIVEVDYELRAP